MEAVIHNIWLPSDQQTAAPGAGQAEKKHLQTSAGASALDKQKLDDEVLQKLFKLLFNIYNKCMIISD